jgi:hypothetical protein
MVARMVSLKGNTDSFQTKGRDLELEHLLTIKSPTKNVIRQACIPQKSISAGVNRDSADVLSPPHTLLYTLLYSQVVVHL